jgi:hypothetical protein
MNKNIKSKHPTKDKIKAIEDECIYSKCINQDVKIPCNKCKISDKYHNLMGIRLEDMTKALNN